MRHLILTAAAIALAGHASASSIEFVTTPEIDNNSVISIGCDQCPPLKTDARKRGYEVPTLAEGAQQVEFVDIDGEARLRRTEAWMGGSPVVFVTKAEGWTAGDGELVAAAPGGGVDLTTTTAAVGAEAENTTGESVTTDDAVSTAATLDTEQFQLRLR